VHAYAIYCHPFHGPCTSTLPTDVLGLYQCWFGVRVRVLASQPSDFLEVCQRLSPPSGITAREASDGRSAIRTVARHLLRLPHRPSDRDLAGLATTDPVELDGQLRSLAVPHDDSSRSLRQTISRARRALKWAGVEIADGRGRRPVSETWHPLLQKLPKNASKALFPFASWCSQQDLLPDEVNERVLQDYKSVLQQRRPAGSVMQTVRLIVRTWNSTVVGSSIAVSRTLTVPGVQKRRYLRRDLPGGLLEEIDAWVHSFRRGRISEKTAQKRRYLARLIASDYWNVTGHRPTTVDDLITREAAESVVKAVAARTRTHDANSPSAYEIARTLCNLAKWRSPHDFRLIEDMERLRLDYAPKDLGLSRKNRSLLRYFANLDNALKLRSYPTQRYRILLAKSHLEPTDCTELTVAFAMHFLMVAPLRPGLICSATIGPDGNVREQHFPTRRVLLCWKRPPSASGGPLEYELTGESLELYDRYISRVREENPGAATSYLFPGRGQRHKSAAWFSQQIAQFTAREDVLGIRLNVSALRHVLAFINLVQDRDAREDAGRYLGHSRKTSLERTAALVDAWRAEGAFKDWAR